MVMVFWVLTPLQSAILGTGTVIKTSLVTVTNRSQLLPLKDQQARMGPELLNDGYAVGWLGQEYPPFMTSEYAILPYYVANDTAAKAAGSNLTSTTTRLTTGIHCWPAQVLKRLSSPATYDFLNGQGCNASIPIGAISDYSLFYIGYYSTAYTAYSLEYLGCAKNDDSVHQSLAIWAKWLNRGDRFHEEYDITAQFCQTRYHKQQVTASVNSQNLRPIDKRIQGLSNPTTLEESEFNSTAFEYLISSGMPVGAESGLRDFPFQSVITQTNRLRKFNLSEPISPMVGYALAGQSRPLADYKDPAVLTELFNRTHKYLFSMAVNKLLLNDTKFANQTAHSEYELSGIIVSRDFTIAVESILGSIAILSCILLWLCLKAPSKLAGNPNSIARLADICGNSPDVLQSFSRVDTLDSNGMLSHFKHSRFRIAHNGCQTSTTPIIEAVGGTTMPAEESRTRNNEGQYDPIQPFALRRTMGFVFLLVLGSGISIIVYLKSREKSLGGGATCTMARNVAIANLANDNIQVSPVHPKTSKFCNYLRTTFQQRLLHWLSQFGFC